MRETLRRRVEIGVVLQGGGALGAYEWGAIDALLEMMDESDSRRMLPDCLQRGDAACRSARSTAACVVGATGSRGCATALERIVGRF